MLLNETELLERDAKRNIGEELLQAIQDIKIKHQILLNNFIIHLNMISLFTKVMYKMRNAFILL